jgi:propanol-preferring alcohol dehydrogenase
LKDWDVKPPLPRIVGHEGIGEVVQLGSNVDDHVKKGDIVGVPWLQKTCLHCEYCLTGRETLCWNQRNTGFTIDGSFAEYTVIDANFAIKLPEGMDPYTSAPLFCAGLTVYKALKVSQARPGQWVSIIGIGGLGKLSEIFLLFDGEIYILFLRISCC